MLSSHDTALSFAWLQHPVTIAASPAPSVSLVKTAFPFSRRASYTNRMDGIQGNRLENEPIGEPIGFESNVIERNRIGTD